MEGRIQREGSAGSALSGLSLTQSQIESIAEEDDGPEEKVYVAVGKEFKEWKENLRWVIKNINPDHKIVFLHVHQPAMKIPMPLGYFPADRVEQNELQAYRLVEKDKMNKELKPYIDNCKAYKFRAIIQTIENSDIAKGLTEFINMYKIENLIMGAASDTNFSKTKRDKAPRSRTATYVQKNADPSCRIRFVCKGEIICIREAGQHILNMNSLSRSCSSTSSNNSIHLTQSQSLPPGLAQETLDSSLNQRAMSINVGSSYLMYNEYPRSSSAFSENDNNSTISDSLRTTPFDNSPPLYSNMTDDMYTQLKDLHLELEKLKREAYEESCRRRKAEMDILELRRQLFQSKENSLRMETIIRHDFKEKIDQERSKVREQEKMLDILNKELNDLLGQKISINCTEFTYSEIREATDNFNMSNRIGEGGFGTVFRGFLRHTEVAIKIRKKESIQGDKEFNQEVLILSRIRHPNFVTLIGACLEAKALVYEILPRGSLEDHLTRKNNIKALPWQARVRIALDVCTALIFLHSTEPHGIAHGDIKPANILLDSNNVCKLSDFGTCRELEHTSTTLTPYHITENPKGSFAYMDPEYLHSAKMTPKYDVFSFGIVILRLVTGMDPKNIRNAVLLAMKEKRLQSIVDPLAGEWPSYEVEKMVVLGLRCSDPVSQNRPNLANDVWNLIKSMVDLTSS